MALTDTSQLSPREFAIMEAEQEDARLAREHAIRLKELDLELQREDRQSQILLKELETKWNSWLKIPKLIVLLPVLILLGVAYVCSMFTKKEMPKRFWDLLS